VAEQLADGVQYVSGYLTINANTAICLAVFGLTANARYGLSLQIMGIAAGMAAVWPNTKFPMITNVTPVMIMPGAANPLAAGLAPNHHLFAARGRGVSWDRPC